MPSFVALAVALSAVSLLPAAEEDRNVEMCMQIAMQIAGLDPTTPDWNCGDSVMTPTCLDKAYVVAREGLVCAQEYSTAKQLKVFSMEALSTPTQSKATYECLYEKMKTCESSDEDVFCKDTHSCLEQVRCVMTQFNFCMKDDVWPVDKLRSKAEMAAFDVKPFTDCVRNTVDDRCDGEYGSPCGIAVSFDCGVSKDLFPYFTSDAVPFFSHSASPDCVKQSHAACLDGADFCSKESSVDLCLSQLKCTMEGINQCADYKFISPELIPTGMLTDVDCLSNFMQVCYTNTEHFWTDSTGYRHYHTDRTFDGICAASKALYCTTAKPAMEKLKTDLKECVSEVKDTCGFGEPSKDWACAKMEGNSAMTTECYKMSSCALRSATQCINDAILLFFPDKPTTPVALPTSSPATAAPVTLAPPSVPAAEEDRNVEMCMQTAMQTADLDPTTPDWNCGDSVLSPMCLDKAYVAARQGLVCVQEYSTAKQLKVFSMEALSTPTQSKATYECLYEKMKTCESSDEDVFCKDTHSCLEQVRCVMTQFNFCMKDDVWPVDKLRSKAEMAAFDVEPFTDCIRDNADRCDGAGSFGGNQVGVSVSDVCVAAVSFDCGVSKDLFPYFTSDAVPFFSHSASPDCVKQSHAACLDGEVFCGAESSIALCLSQLKCTMEGINQCADYKFISPELIPTGMLTDVDCLSSFDELCKVRTVHQTSWGTTYKTYDFDTICVASKALYCTTAKPAMEKLKTDLKECVSEVKDTCGFGEPSKDWACAKMEGNSAMTTECYKMSSCALRSATQCINDAILLFFPDKVAQLSLSDAPPTSSPLSPDRHTATPTSSPVVSSLSPDQHTATPTASPVVSSLSPDQHTATPTASPVVSSLSPDQHTATPTASPVVSSLSPDQHTATPTASPVVSSLSPDRHTETPTASPDKPTTPVVLPTSSPATAAPATLAPPSVPAEVEDRNVEMCMKTAMQTADLDPTTPDWNCGDSVLSPMCLDKAYVAARQGLVCVQEYSAAKQLKVFSMEALSTPTQSKATYECLYEKMKTCESSDEDMFCKDTHSCLEQVRCVMTQFNFCMKDDVWPVDKLRSKAEMAAFDVKPFTDCVSTTVRERCYKVDDAGYPESACVAAVSFDCGVSKDLFPYFTSDAVPFFSHSASPDCVTQSHEACLDGAEFCSADASVDLCLSQLKCTMEGFNQCADYKFISPELIPTGMLTDVDCLSNFMQVCYTNTEHFWTDSTGYRHYHTDRTFDGICAASKALYCTTAKPAMEKLKTDLKECVSEVKDTCGFGEPSKDWACAKMEGNSAMTTECYKMSSCALRSATQCINDAILLFFPDKPTTPVALPTSSPATAAPATLAPPSVPAAEEDRNVEMCMKTAMQTADLDPTTPDWNCGDSVLSPMCLDKAYVAAREGLVCVQEYSTAKQLKVFSMEALSTPTQSKETYECLYEKMKTCESSDEDVFCKDTHSCLEQVRCVMTQFNFCMKDDVWPVDKLRSKAEMAAFDVEPFTDCVRNTVDDRCDGKYGSACGIAVSFDCGVSKDLFPYFTSGAVPFFSHSASPECVTQSHAACLDGAGFCSKDSSVDLCLSQLKCTMEGINQCADYKFISPELIPTGMLTDVDCLSSFVPLCGKKYDFDAICAASKALYCTTAKPAMEKLKTDLKECVSEVKDTCGFGEPSKDWACAKMEGNSAMTTECYKMSSCALRSATQCINDAILLFFPDAPEQAAAGAADMSSDSDSTSTGVWIGVAVGAVVLLLAGVGGVIMYTRKASKPKTEDLAFEDFTNEVLYRADAEEANEMGEAALL